MPHYAGVEKIPPVVFAFYIFAFFHVFNLFLRRRLFDIIIGQLR